MKEIEDNDDNEDHNNNFQLNQQISRNDNSQYIKTKINKHYLNNEGKKASIIRIAYVSFSTLIEKCIQNDRFYLINSISSNRKTAMLIKGINSIKDDFIYVHPIIMQLIGYPTHISINSIENEM